MKAAFLAFPGPAGGCSPEKLPPYPAILTAYITWGEESLCPLENLFQSIGSNEAILDLLSYSFQPHDPDTKDPPFTTQCACSRFQKKLKYRVNSRSPASKPTTRSKYHVYFLFYLFFTIICSDISFVF